MSTFYGFDCVAGNISVVIKRDSTGLYFECSEGKHYLERQVDTDGLCIGLTALI